jgi:hypothetical protein
LKMIRFGLNEIGMKRSLPCFVVSSSGTFCMFSRIVMWKKE